MANFDSTYRGLVVRNNDPQAEARVILRIPQILGDADSAWARPVASTSVVPNVGDTVYVTFEGGDIAYPVYTPMTTDGGAIPVPKPPASVTPTVATSTTPEGVTLADITLTWPSVTENQDGSTPVNLAGYLVYVTTDSAVWSSGNLVDAQPGAATGTFVLRAMPTGHTYYFRVGSVNSDMQRSATVANSSVNVPAVAPPAGTVLGDQAAAIGASVKNVTTEYAVNSSEAVAPTTGWGTATPTRTPGTFIWYRVTVTRNDSSTSTTSPALLTGNTGATGATGSNGADGAPGAPAALVNLTANTQVLALPTGASATNPATATVTGSAANTTIANWTYSVDGAAFSATVPAGVSRSTNTVTVTGQTMTARTIAIKADNGAGVADTLTVAKVADGATGPTGSTGGTGPAGANAYTVLLTNEAQVFPGSTSAALAGSATTSVMAYQGTTAQSATIGTITGQVTGLTTAITNNGTTSPVVTVTVTTSLTQQSGTLTIPVTVGGVAFTKSFAWSVSYTGATGATGSTGPTGPTGVSVSSITPYFQTVTAGAAAPAAPTASPPAAPWTGTEPSYVANTDLYRTERVLFSNSTFTYTTVTKVSSYAAATAAVTSANGKSKVTYSTAAPGTTANSLGDIWFQYVAGGTIIAQWTGQGGTTWQPNTLRDEVIASVNMGKLVSGTINATTKATIGTPAAARVEIDGTSGINAFDSTNANTFKVDPATGNVTLKGTINAGSSIVGSLFKTAATGARWEMGAGTSWVGDTRTFLAYTGRSDETAPAKITSDVSGNITLQSATFTGQTAPSSVSLGQTGSDASTMVNNGNISLWANQVNVSATADKTESGNTAGQAIHTLLVNSNNNATEYSRVRDETSSVVVPNAGLLRSTYKRILVESDVDAGYFDVSVGARYDTAYGGINVTKNKIDFKIAGAVKASLTSGGLSANLSGGNTTTFSTLSTGWVVRAGYEFRVTALGNNMCVVNAQTTTASALASGSIIVPVGGLPTWARPSSARNISITGGVSSPSLVPGVEVQSDGSIRFYNGTTGAGQAQGIFGVYIL